MNQYEPMTVGKCKYCKRDIMDDGKGTFVKFYGLVHEKCERKRNREIRNKRRMKKWNVGNVITIHNLENMFTSQ